MNKPTDSVRIVIFDANDAANFLVLIEADDPKNWKLPGGKFDSIDETPEAAASRELCEELALVAEEVVLKRVGQLTNDDGVSARYIFSAKTEKEQPEPSVEVATTKWVTTESVPDSPNRHHILTAVNTARNA